MKQVSTDADLMRLSYDVGVGCTPAVVRDANHKHWLLGENRDGILFAVSFGVASASEREPNLNAMPDFTYENLAPALEWWDATDLLAMRGPFQVLYWPNGGPDADLPKPDGQIVVGKHDGIPDRDIGQAEMSEAQLLATASGTADTATRIHVTDNAPIERPSVLKAKLIELMDGKPVTHGSVTIPAAMPRVFPMNPVTAQLVREDIDHEPDSEITWDALLDWARGEKGGNTVEVLATDETPVDDVGIVVPGDDESTQV